MRYFILALILLFATLPAAHAEAELQNALKQPYPAPEITGITAWAKGTPQSIADLTRNGHVVLIDFWTYSCINCLRTMPHLKEWHEKYADKGLTIIGLHAPEFDFEKDPANVERAIDRFGISWPIGLDNDKATWRAYQNKYWPAKYLINQQGQVVYTHFGEGDYDITEHNIRTLLKLDEDTKLNPGKDVTADHQTPETYFGTLRAKNEYTQPVTDPAKVPLHNWQIQGQWSRQSEYIESGAAGDTFYLHFHGKKVFAVMAANGGKQVTANVKLEKGGVWADLGVDAPDGQLRVSDSRLYELVDLPAAGDGVLKIVAMEPGLQIYAFTFESDPQE